MSSNVTNASSTAPQRRAWVAPEVRDLPRLTELTLQTVGGAIPGGGSTGGGGGTVIP
ncbi:MAG TPA: hypothetical protein VE913_24380 [Longimicrobium sp.]|nr:hypothetical protein [Longimicrobium sp.]